MRRMLGLAVAMVLLGAAACADPSTGRAQASSHVSGAGAMAKASHRASAAAVTRQVCTSAVRAARETRTVFNAQMAVIEVAATRNDQAAIIAAATAIIDTLVDGAATLDALSRLPAAAGVTSTLMAASRSLAGMASASYAGTSADQRQTLADIAAGLASVCR